MQGGIVKRKPGQLWVCNTMHLNGCEKYCTEYVKGVGQQGCEHYKKLCRPFEAVKQLYEAVK